MESSRKSTNKKGQSIIEILIVIALMAAVIPPLLMAIMASRDGNLQQEKRLQAAALMKETQDALRLIRENGWSALATPGVYHLAFVGSSWTIQTAPDTSNGFTRQIEIFNVSRLNNQIVESGGSPDPSTKKIVTTLSWSEPFPTSVSSTIYLTRYLENDIYSQTTQAQFDTGSKTNVITTNVENGEITLGAGGEGNWCSPQLTIAALNLPGQGEATAVTSVFGRSYVTTGGNASGQAFLDISLSDTSPPVAKLEGAVNGYKANDIYVDPEDPEYIYITTNKEEVVVIRRSTYQVVGIFDPSGIGSETAKAVYVKGNVGYVTRASTFFTFNLTDKANPTVYDSVALDGTGTSIEVRGDYAYVSISGSSTKLQIINVSNPSDLPTSVQTGRAVFTAGDAQDLAVNDNGNRAYLVTALSTADEFFVIDTTSKTGTRSFIDGIDSGTMDPKAVVIVPGNKAIMGGYGGIEYQVIELLSETNLTKCGDGLDLPSNVNDLSSILEPSDGDAYTYIVTTDSNTEFRIIAGGPGGSYATNGVYESIISDLGYARAFNRIIPNFIQPEGTTVEIRIAIADAILGSCNNAAYVFTGPDGTTGSFYNQNAPIKFDDDGTGYENPGRCFKYQVILNTTNSASTPVFNDITINYSP